MSIEQYKACNIGGKEVEKMLHAFLSSTQNFYKFDRTELKIS